MAEPVRARRLTDEEGQRRQRIVRRADTSRYVGRALIIMASAWGNPVTAIARLVAAMRTPSAMRSTRSTRTAWPRWREAVPG